MINFLMIYHYWWLSLAWFCPQSWPTNFFSPTTPFFLLILSIVSIWALNCMVIIIKNFLSSQGPGDQHQWVHFPVYKPYPKSSWDSLQSENILIVKIFIINSQLNGHHPHQTRLITKLETICASVGLFTIFVIKNPDKYMSLFISHIF